MNGLVSDLRHMLRGLWRSPRFAIAGALTLAVGAGGVSGIFMLVDAVLLRPLPYPAPDRLVTVMHSAPGLGLSEAGNSFGTYHHYRDNSRTLQDFAVYNEGVVELSGGGEPERVRIALVTPSFFSTLGVAPALGRPFGPQDGLPGAPVEVVILGHDLWTRRYGADPSIVGRTVELNRRRHKVVGVMPRGFGFPRPETEVWFARDFPAMRGAWLQQLSLSGIARLAANASPDSAEHELNVLVPSLAVTPSEAQEVEEAGLAVHIESLREATLDDLPSVLWLVFAAMVLVLAIAGANVASLFLVRAEERRVEMTVRAALGAGSAERLRLFLIEGVVLGAVAGALAVPLAVGLVAGVKAFGPTDLPRMHEVAFGTPYAVLTVGVALFLGAILSAAPVLRRVLRGGGTPTLRVDQRAPSGPAQRRAMQLLTVSQIAVGFALVVGAALLLQSFWRLRNVDPGFDADSVLTMTVALPHTPYSSEGAEARFWHALLERIQGLPGVVAAGGVVALPLTPGDYSDAFLREPMSIEGVPVPAEGAPVVAFVNVTPGYFEALRIPTLAGNVPTSWSSPSHTVVVNAAFARRFVAGQDPLDARLHPIERGYMDVPWHDVTAVVGDVRDEGLVADPTPLVYVPVNESLGEQSNWNGNMNLAIRTSVPPLSLTGAVRALVRDIDPRLPIARVRTMEDIVARAMAPERFMTLALSLAAMIALFLAAIGTYGLLAYAVSRRAHELGVRIALGAPAARVRRLVLRQGALLAAGGLAMGVAAALAAGRMVQGLLYEISAFDPATLTVASLVLFIVVLLAVDVPARRAAQLDPIEALRDE